MQKALGKMLSLGDRSMPGVGVAGGSPTLLPTSFLLGMQSHEDMMTSVATVRWRWRGESWPAC